MKNDIISRATGDAGEVDNLPIELQRDIGYWWTLLAQLPFPRKPIKSSTLVKRDPKSGVQIDMHSTVGKLPYGVYSRRIFLWLITQIKKQVPNAEQLTTIPREARTIKLPASPSEFFRLVTSNNEASSKLYHAHKRFHDQLTRIVSLIFSVNYSKKDPKGRRTSMQRINMVESFSYYFLSPDYVKAAGHRLKYDENSNDNYLVLGEDFVRCVIGLRQVFPVDLQLISDFNALDFDIYTLLSYRLGIAAITRNNTLRTLTWQHIHDTFFDEPPASDDQRRSRKMMMKKKMPEILKKIQKRGMLKDVALHIDNNGITINGLPDIELKTPNLKLGFK